MEQMKASTVREKLEREDGQAFERGCRGYIGVDSEILG